jgi:hypothetical protein
MAILIEATCVVVRADAIIGRYPGGWVAFRDSAPNRTLVCDNEIASVGFMASQDVDNFIRHLQSGGLRFLEGGQTQDMAIVDQWQGVTTPCDWLEFGHMGGEGTRVSACRLTGSREERLFTPDGWVYEGSASQTLRFLSTEEVAKSMDYVERQGNLDVYRDRATGKLLYVGRAGDKTE